MLRVLSKPICTQKKSSSVGMIDYIVRMKTGEMGIIETKGKETEQDRVKKRFLQEWIDAVNQHGGFGKWAITKSKFSTRE